MIQYSDGYYTPLYTPITEKKFFFFTVYCFFYKCIENGIKSVLLWLLYIFFGQIYLLNEIYKLLGKCILMKFTNNYESYLRNFCKLEFVYFFYAISEMKKLYIPKI